MNIIINKITMNPLSGILATNSNKCIHIDSTAINTVIDEDKKLLKSIIFISITYVYANWVNIKKGSNLLYYLSGKYQYQDLTDYILYLNVCAPDCEVNITKYLIYLVCTYTYLKHDLLPYLIYLGVDIEYEYNIEQQRYPKVQYFNILGVDNDNIVFDTQYLTIVNFDDYIEYYDSNSNYLVCVSNTWLLKTNKFNLKNIYRSGQLHIIDKC